MQITTNSQNTVQSRPLNTLSPVSEAVNSTFASLVAQHVETAKNDPAAPKIASPVVENSVDSALFRWRDTGSVFNSKDAHLMQVRDVSPEDRQRFTDIIKDAAANGGYNDPVSYVHALPAEDQHVLRRVHSLAELSGVRETDTEGALNLLLPPSGHVDINNDAVVKTGASAGFVFPPPNSPQSVKDAWENISQDMSFEEKMMAELQFMTRSIGANLKLNGDGVPVGIYDYTDPEYSNVFSTTEAGWQTMLGDMIEEYEKALSRSPGLATHINTFRELRSAMDPL